MSALRTHSGNDQVAQYACAAMVNISVYDNAMKNSIAEFGGITAVITAIKEHPNNYDVCKCGCAVLGTLSSGNRKKYKNTTTFLLFFITNPIQIKSKIS